MMLMLILEIDGLGKDFDCSSSNLKQKFAKA
jgi:hypothetical protein